MASLTVSDIRREIWRAAGIEPAGGPGAEAGRLFHATVADALSGDSPAAWVRFFDPERLRRPDAALEYAHALYEESLGPALAAHAAAFEAQPEALLQLWRGVKNFAQWLTGALRECESRGLIRWAGRQGWQGAEGLARTELPLHCSVRRPDWRSTVEISGTLDALWRDAATGRWCVVEWKLASASPEADLAQLCLYHLMLEKNGVPGAAALVAFTPEPVQTVLEPSQLEPLKQKLLDLIGMLAGAAGVPRRSVVLPPPPRRPQAFVVSPEDEELARRTVDVLRARGHAVELGPGLAAGPSYLRVPVRLEPRTSVRRVLAEGDNLQVQLGLATRPFLRKGEGCLFVEVPRGRREIVEFGSIDLGPAASLGAPLLVGVDLAGAPHFADLASPQTPHLLVAGATGSGKSEWLRTALASMMATHTPADLRVVPVDPKRTAFGELRGSPYLWPRLGLLTPPDQDMEEAFDALIEEMEQRYRALERQGIATLAEWRGRPGTRPPRIVVFCDEYADLIHGAAQRRELEKRVARLGAKGRAAGVHLILATQRASRDVVTGVIKANLAGRVCLRVAEAIESRLVLGVAGAEDLTGCGDLLWSGGGEPLRLQAPLLDEASRKRLFGAARAAGGA
ncbi:MAG: FtsK/SpoIIIE domain-containing protein [Bryobacteraceae bacterium]|nr:FtsK/SpoIIIE domain-containing protein [Bryobacteraceae bacterium]